MTLGCLILRFFKRPLDIFCQFLPQILFLTSIFTYLVWLIFFKWIFFSIHPKETLIGYYPGSHCAPSLLIGFINMFMMKDRPHGFEGPSCFLNTFYYGQVRFMRCARMRRESMRFFDFADNYRKMFSFFGVGLRSLDAAG